MKILKTMVGDFYITESEARGAEKSLNEKSSITFSRTGMSIAYHQLQAILPMYDFKFDEAYYHDGERFVTSGDSIFMIMNKGERMAVGMLPENSIPMDKAIELGLMRNML